MRLLEKGNVDEDVFSSDMYASCVLGELLLEQVHNLLVKVF